MLSRLLPVVRCPSWTPPLFGAHAFRSVTFDANPLSSAGRVGDVVLVKKRSADLLNDPLYNKGSGFPLAERDRLGIRGLVPPRCQTRGKELEVQATRILSRMRANTADLDKYVTMVSLQDRNEVLFYYLLKNNIDQLAKIIYTPTVGLACQEFAHIFRRTRGMYFSSDDANNMHAMVYNWPIDDVQCIVVTDGSRILGLGDLGANGIGIPIGKLSLYTVGAGFHPSRCLPVVLDVGTNNAELLNDPLYLGLPQRRLTGEAYFRVFDEFISAVTERWPKALIQFEDFSNENATVILDRYRDKILCFNDDIQGTGSMALSGVLSAIRAIGQEQSAITQQRIVILGAGTAGLGVANAITYGMQQMGCPADVAKRNIWMVDNRGLLGSARTSPADAQVPFLRSDLPDGLSLYDTVKAVKPTILIGLSGVGQVFTQDIVEEMAKHVERPIVFPLSNPTTRAECTAEQAFAWTRGKCIFASGSPFDKVTLPSGQVCTPNQANNMFTFPGVGLGAVSCAARTVSDRMLFAASTTLAAEVTPDLLQQGRIFPSLSQIPSVSQKIAIAICKVAREEGIATVPVPNSDEEIFSKLIAHNIWEPHYAHLVSPYQEPQH